MAEESLGMLNNDDGMRRLDTLYRSTDYKACLLAWVAVSAESRGEQSRLAAAAGCQRSYLSQVINGNQHLTMEHGVQLAQHYHFDDSATDYWLDLISLGRAGSKALREQLQRRLARRRTEWSELGSRVAGKCLSPDQQRLYYSAWYWGAIHVALSIPSLQHVEVLTQSLGIPRSTVAQVLTALEEMGLVRCLGKDRWESTGGHFHLPRQSPYNAINHLNWRQRSMVAPFNDEDSFRFSSCLSLSVSCFEQIRESLKVFLGETARDIDRSNPEFLAALNIDLFPLIPADKVKDFSRQ